VPVGDDLTIVLFFASLAFGFGLETMKAETAPRKVMFAVMTAGCLLSAVFWLQLKRIWPPFTDATVSVGTNPVAWFVVLMFILAVFAFHPAKSRKAVGPPKSELIPPPTVADKPAVSAEPSRKIFIDASPAFLTAMYENRTSYQADALAEAYKGKWISITGEVRDVMDISGGEIIVIVHVDKKIVSARFLEEDKERVLQLGHGASISLQGEIHEVNDYLVKLRNCKFT
jgi:tRNA_anti-like